MNCLSDQYQPLSSEQLNEIETVCSRWLFPQIKQIRDKPFIEFMNSLYDWLSRLDLGPLVHSFTQRLNQVEYEFTEREELSGSIVFFGGIFCSLLHYGYIKEIDGLFMFSLGYMLIDHFIDDSTISETEKKKNMKEVFHFMKTLENNSANPIIKAAYNNYINLIQKLPHCQHHLINLFQAEVKSSKIQSQNNLSRKEYHDLADEKGGLTGVAIGSVLGINDSTGRHKGYNYQLASCLQFVDDLFDLDDDTELNIYTLARYDYDHGTLDNYVYETVTKINDLPNVYNFFKVILLYMTMLGIHDHKEAFSDEFLETVNRYIPFDPETNKETIVSFFHEKLYNYIRLNNLR